MSDTVSKIQDWAIELGGIYARLVEDKKYLKVKQAVREACLMNSCGRSGRCWTCPPNVGELEQLGDLLLSFDNVIVIQTVARIEDSWDFEGMAEAGQKHNNMMREIRNRLREQGNAVDLLVLGCGGCGYCEKCTCPDEPCRFPDEALGSVEGYGLDVKALVESIGLQYINGVNTVSYVGAVLIK